MTYNMTITCEHGEYKLEECTESPFTAEFEEHLDALKDMIGTRKRIVIEYKQEKVCKR